MPEHWHALQHVVQRRVLRYFSRHDLLDEAATHGIPDFMFDQSLLDEFDDCWSRAAPAVFPRQR